jgi:hypothetical protein
MQDARFEKETIMNVDKNPVIFIVLAAVTILVGTLATTFIPLFVGTAAVPVEGGATGRGRSGDGRDGGAVRGFHALSIRRRIIARRGWPPGNERKGRGARPPAGIAGKSAAWLAREPPLGVVATSSLGASLQHRSRDGEKARAGMIPAPCLVSDLTTLAR